MPLVVKDKVIVGVSGGEYGIRGFVEADRATFWPTTRSRSATARCAEGQQRL